MSYPIITFRGLSGVGKTTVMRFLLEKRFCRLITGCTTRPPRESDLPDEYHYITTDEFERREVKGDFPWSARFAGNYYGTARSDIDEAKQGTGRRVMILTPNVIPSLYEYTARRMHPLFLYVSSSDILHQRMKQRGDAPEVIETRLRDATDWIEQARNSGVPFIFIDNSGSLDETVRLVEQHCQ